MIIGALIGLFIAAFWTWIALVNLYSEQARMKAQGFRTRVNIHYTPMVMRHVTFWLAGAIIGYFVS